MVVWNKCIIYSPLKKAKLPQLSLFYFVNKENDKWVIHDLEWFLGLFLYNFNPSYWRVENKGVQIEYSLLITNLGGSSMLKILQEKNVRMIWSKNGEEVWFNANDVGEELGIVNIRDTLRNIDREYKKKLMSLLSEIPTLETLKTNCLTLVLLLLQKKLCTICHLEVIKQKQNYLRSGLQKHLNKLEYMVTILPQKKIKNGWI